MFQDPSFQDLLVKSQSGCSLSLNRVLKRIQPFIRNYCYNFYTTSQYKFNIEIDDLVQEVNMRVYKSFSGIKVLKAFKTWLKVICFRSCVDSYKNLKREFFNYPRVRVPIESELDDAGQYSEFDLIECDKYMPHKDTARKELKLILNKEICQSLKSMKHTFAHILAKVRMEDQTYEQYSEENNIAIGTVKSRIFRAMAKLREDLKEANIYRDDLIPYYKC